MSEKKLFKFHRLTPRMVDTDHPSYKVSKKALDESYLDKDIRNIAITGIYGSGKSSFLKTYFQNTNKHKTINVAIADFDNKKDREDKIKIAERQIINQILFQIPSHKIPLSKYNVKNKRNWWQVTLLSICILMFIIGSFSIFNQEILDFLLYDLIGVQNLDLWIDTIILLCLLIPITCATIWISRRLSFKVTRFSFKGTESELMENNAELLDQEAREIVYLILASKVDTIIYEDLDRFNDISIFVRLREINSLVNSRSENKVRFIYVIRDDLFESKDRTKFFDFMIPVIPAVTSHNSRGKVLKIFSDIEEDFLKIDPKILEKVSVYIDDMRLLYSIRNEYEVYSKSLDTDAYANELFALVVLKNVFPKEFEELENDKGYLHKILNKRNSLISAYESELTEKIEDREELKNQIVTNFSDYLAINIPKNYSFSTNESNGGYLYNWYKNKEDSRVVYIGNSRRSYTFNELIDNLSKRDSSLKERLDQINYDNLDLKIKSLNNEIKDITIEINRRYTTKTSELLIELSDERLSQYFEENNKEFESVVKDHYFPLIRFLLLSGLVDENYWRYKGYFHEGFLGQNDNKFINRVLSGKVIKNDFKLDNASTVIEYLESLDYQRKDIINYDLIGELINQQKSEEIFSVMRTIYLNKDIAAIEHLNSFDYTKLQKLVKILLKDGFEHFYEVFSYSIFPENFRVKIAGIACEDKDIYPFAEFNNFVSEHKEVLELDFFEDKNSILDTLDRLKIKFSDISNLEVSQKIYKAIADKKLFIFELDNLSTLLSSSYEIWNHNNEEYLSRFLDFLYGTPYNSLLEYAKENLEVLLDQYIDRIEAEDISSLSGETVLISILNSDVPFETKIRIIGVEKSVISNLKDISNTKLWTDLFKHELIKPTKENFKSYYDEKEDFTQVINYVNKHYKVGFSLSQEMYKNLLYCEDTDIDLFKLISEEVSSQIELVNPKLSVEKYQNLVSNNLILLNKNNINTLLVTDEKNLIVQFFKTIKGENCSKEAILILLDPELLELLSHITIEELINNKVFENVDSIRLLERYDKEISLFNIPESSMEVREYVLKNYFLQSDIEQIVLSFEKFDLWDSFIVKINNDSILMSAFISNKLSKELINKLIEDTSLKETNKIEILKKIISKKKFADRWQMWISLTKSVSKISSVLNNGKPIVKTEEERIIAEVMEEIGVVTVGDDNRLHFKPSKFEIINL